MSSNDQLSMTDGFLLALLGGLPLWATAAFPNTSRPIRNICMAVSAMVVFNWVVLPVGRWLWQRFWQGGSRAPLPARYPRAR